MKTVTKATELRQFGWEMRLEGSVKVMGGAVHHLFLLEFEKNVRRETNGHAAGKAFQK